MSVPRPTSPWHPAQRVAYVCWMSGGFCCAHIDGLIKTTAIMMAPNLVLPLTMRRRKKYYCVFTERRAGSYGAVASTGASGMSSSISGSSIRAGLGNSAATVSSGLGATRAVRGLGMWLFVGGDAWSEPAACCGTSAGVATGAAGAGKESDTVDVWRGVRPM